MIKGFLSAEALEEDIKEKVGEEEEKNAWAETLRNDIKVIGGTSRVGIIGWVSAVKPARNIGGEGYSSRAIYTF